MKAWLVRNNAVSERTEDSHVLIAAEDSEEALYKGGPILEERWWVTSEHRAAGWHVEHIPELDGKTEFTGVDYLTVGSVECWLCGIEEFYEIDNERAFADDDGDVFCAQCWEQRAI
ncbi:hypothetical protein [Nitrolancea hollandica]|uniref:Uncharacterized protein n=1 Tax=Nitrolancea hollandica Lb TaxID=1129897 RepID=I4EG16_9BACT|nr:hypothetical protein [Nitrolancea hollandica]CCF83628.1 hypothetical protein NITHO_2520003 [Nitrolancea hollandica Lb]